MSVSGVRARSPELSPCASETSRADDSTVPVLLRQFVLVTRCCLIYIHNKSPCICTAGTKFCLVTALENIDKSCTNFRWMFTWLWFKMGKGKGFLVLTLSNNTFHLGLVFFTELQNSIVALTRKGTWLDNLLASLGNVIE